MTVAFPHPMNSFTCDADTLSALLDDPCPSSGDSFWTARTVRLIRITAPVLAWVRDHEGVPLHMEQIY